MPNEPTRPGKHRARHKAPSGLSKLTSKLSPRASLPAVRVPSPSRHRPVVSVPVPIRRHGATLVAVGGVAVAAAAVSGSALGTSAPADAISAAAVKRAEVASAKYLADRGEGILNDTSRDSIRAQISEMRPADGADATHLGAGGVSSAEQLMPTNPREIAMMMLADYGWDSTQFSCLDDLWVGESNWEVSATNPTSGAYGIPQSLPAEKMASAGSDWATNPATQIEWGLGYIAESYGSPCAANDFKTANNWY